MRKLASILILLTLLFCHGSMTADNIRLEDVSGLDIPVLIINTVDGEEPAYTVVEHPEGAIGTSITNAKAVPARMVIVLRGDTLYDSGNYIKDAAGMTIKVTGNTSALGQQKPYKIKLQKKHNLLTTGGAEFADKEWRLLAKADCLNTVIAWQISQSMHMAWTPRYGYCNLFMNDRYRGCYMLSESVKAKANGRVAIDTESGYLVERDAYWWNEDLCFESDFYATDSQYRWTFKYPSAKDVSTQQVQYIQDYINSLEAHIYHEQDYPDTYSDYMDVESAAKWLLIHDIIGTHDSGGSNMYYAKNDDTPASRLTMPVIWDVDGSFGQDYITRFARIHTSSHSYFPKLLSHTNPDFTRAYCSQWHSICPTLLDGVRTQLQDLQASSVGKAVEQSVLYTNQQLYNESQTYSIQQEATEKLKWLSEHIQWLDGKIAEYSASSLNTVPYHDTKSSEIYNIYGQRVESLTSTKGLPRAIYIINGRKTIR